MVQAVKKLDNVVFNGAGQNFLRFLPSSVAKPGDEIKTALQVRIFGRFEKDGVVYYKIKIWLIFDPQKVEDFIEKRYNNFVQLHNDLISSGYENLPNMPAKKIGLLMNENDKWERQNQLENYLKG